MTVIANAITGVIDEQSGSGGQSYTTTETMSADEDNLARTLTDAGTWTRENGAGNVLTGDYTPTQTAGDTLTAVETGNRAGVGSYSNTDTYTSDTTLSQSGNEIAGNHTLSQTSTLTHHSEHTAASVSRTEDATLTYTGEEDLEITQHATQTSSATVLLPLRETSSLDPRRSRRH